jgi:glycogen debranching enzyme
MHTITNDHPVPATPASLRARAQRVLRENDRGGYTVPSSKLYPFQWNWDAGVTALGWITFDEPRAWQELDMLLRGQWDNGLVPHIVFHQDAATYFPGPDQWGVAHVPPTSSISQPPLLATVVRMMHARAADRELAEARTRALLPKLMAYHRWWYRDRDPEQTGLVVSYHPWESGMDNSPAWDAPLAAVPPVTRDYQRRDTELVNAAQRPHKAEYDRFLYLVDLFKSLDFDAGDIYRQSPFRVADFGLNAILQRATLDLAALCRQFGHADWAAELDAYASRAAPALRACWSDELNQYLSRDTLTGKALALQVHSGFLAWYARLDDPAHSAKLQAGLADWLAKAAYGVASTHPQAAQFEAQRYWRGPVWPHVNWLIAEGCAHYGLHALHDQIRENTQRLLSNGGLFEYFDPHTGQGYGGDNFSWTAAIVLYWLQGAPT